jgi:hypothetical protein
MCRADIPGPTQVGARDDTDHAAAVDDGCSAYPVLMKDGKRDAHGRLRRQHHRALRHCSVDRAQELDHVVSSD